MHYTSSILGRFVAFIRSVSEICRSCNVIVLMGLRFLPVVLSVAAVDLLTSSPTHLKDWEVGGISFPCESESVAAREPGFCSGEL